MIIGFPTVSRVDAKGKSGGLSEGQQALKIGALSGSDLWRARETAASINHWGMVLLLAGKSPMNLMMVRMRLVLYGPAWNRRKKGLHNFH